MLAGDQGLSISNVAPAGGGEATEESIPFLVRQARAIREGEAAAKERRTLRALERCEAKLRDFETATVGYAFDPAGEGAGEGALRREVVV